MATQIEVPFNIDFTLDCGQAFRWKRVDDGWWYGVIRESAVKVRQVGGMLEFQASLAEFGMDFLGDYFRLDDNLDRVYQGISRDAYVKKAIEQFYGLRIIHQDPWECLASYICATFKNIPAIKLMILSLSRKFGKRFIFDGREFHTFPSAEALAEANVNELKECGLGFRASYVQEAARMVSEGELDLGRLGEGNYELSRKELLSLRGVGPKVADCVLLFSFGFLQAFPVDVWMERITRRLYFCEAKVSPKAIREFGMSYFAEYAGYAQQYLYYAGRLGLL